MTSSEEHDESVTSSRTYLPQSSDKMCPARCWIMYGMVLRVYGPTTYQIKGLLKV